MGNDIVRSKILQHPFLKIGSNKNIAIKLVPDYSLKVEENFALVLDAKSPDKKINDTSNVEQVFCYSRHPEVRNTYFALYPEQHSRVRAKRKPTNSFETKSCPIEAAGGVLTRMHSR